MLFYKAWRESRGRFLIAASFLIVTCLVFVVFNDMFRAQMSVPGGEPVSFVAYIYRRVYGGFARGMFTLLALILGLGGLERERSQGTAAFTLALPVSRTRHIMARALVGLGQITILSLLPLLLVPGTSLLVRREYPWTQAFSFAMLWIAVGAVIFAAAFLVSVIFTSEYNAMTAALVAFYVYPLVVVRTPVLQSYPLHIHYIMNGTRMAYVDPHTHLFIGPFPWAIVIGVSAVTLAFLLLATRVTQRADFS